MTADATRPTSSEPSANGNGHRPITRAERDRLRGSVGKTRPKGTLPFLRRDEGDLEYFRQWLTLAFVPQDGYEFESFERWGKRTVDPCTIVFRAGPERRQFDLERQADLIGPKLRATTYAIGGGCLRMGDLKRDEASDVWAALCIAGRIETEHDEQDDARKWMEQLLDASSPLRGMTLAEQTRRHDALMAIKHAGEFRQADAYTMVHGGEDFPRKPLRFVDSETGEQWVRVGETFTYVKWVVGELRIDRAGLRARLERIGLHYREWRDRRTPPQKARLYRLTDELVAYVEDAGATPLATGQTPRNDKGEEMMF